MLCGKPFQALFNLCLWVLSLFLLIFGVGFALWAICSFHALMLCRISYADKRLNKVVKAMERSAQPAAAPMVLDQ